MSRSILRQGGDGLKMRMDTLTRCERKYDGKNSDSCEKMRWLRSVVRNASVDQTVKQFRLNSAERV